MHGIGVLLFVSPVKVVAYTVVVIEGGICMKRICCTAGLCFLSAGLGILLAIFLPHSILICLEALLIVFAGLLILFAK